MELPSTIESNIGSERLQNMLKMLTKCRIDYINEKNDSKKLREAYTKMELELKEARELEKSNRYSLQSSRDMIVNLQETVSQLVYLKRDNNKLKDEITFKDNTNANLKKNIENLKQKYNENIEEIQKQNEKHTADLITINEKKIQQVQYDLETQVAQYTCVIEELRSKIKDMEDDHSDIIILAEIEYEEKIKKSAAETTQLQDKIAMQTAMNDANIDAYKRKIDELEEKLKQSQFKEYLAKNSISSQMENKVEGPYSVNRDYCSGLNSVPGSSRLTSNSKKPRLQIMYDSGTLPKNEEQTHFTITKKRKLYSEKDFLNQ